MDHDKVQLALEVFQLMPVYEGTSDKEITLRDAAIKVLTEKLQEKE